MEVDNTKTVEEVAVSCCKVVLRHWPLENEQNRNIYVRTARNLAETGLVHSPNTIVQRYRCIR
jgi:hypothetical protein